MIRKLWRNLLYPSYECEQCVGQEPWRGCYCAYFGCVAPNKGCETWRSYLRMLNDCVLKREKEEKRN